MRCRVGLIIFALLLCSPMVVAQVQPPSEKLTITARHASTREQGSGTIIEADGNVSIQIDRAVLSADSAVVWLDGGDAADSLQHAQIAMIGNAKVEQKGSTRSGARLLVSVDVRGSIRLTAERQPAPAEATELFKSALAMKEEQGRVAGAPEAPVEAPMRPVAPPPQPNTTATVPRGTAPGGQVVPPERAEGNPIAPSQTSGAISGPLEPLEPSVNNSNALSQQTARRPNDRLNTIVPTTQQQSPLYFQAKDIQTSETSDKTVAVVLTGGVTLFQRRPRGDTIELQAERAVLFTSLKSLKEIGQGDRQARLQDSILAAYLEGDVRIVYTAATYKDGEQRLTADRVYYELATDRAVLTDAIVQTVDPLRQIPMVLRAKLVRQLSAGEFSANKATLTTSTFALPSLAIAADRMYVRSEPLPGPPPEQQVFFNAKDVTFPIFGVPIFYWPGASGMLNEDPEPLRGIGFENRSEFGFGVETEWGLFETLGVRPPRDLDIGYRVDYFSERGPGFGLSAAYRGGVVSDTTKQPFGFDGNFQAYFVDDKGEDNLGRQPVKVNASEHVRGRVAWEHQQFFPEDWQLQLRAGWVSDATFLEQWFRREYEENQPLDVAAYIKRQRDTEAFTLLVDVQPSRVVTNSDLAQEQFEVERYPEIGYRRIGDAPLDNKLTFFSDNTGDALHYQFSRTPLNQQGYATQFGLTPGLPSLGTTGTTDKTVLRANFRQEVDYPFTVGPVRFVPYTEGILTQYSDSPVGGEKTRLLVGGGARFSTEFWKVDPTAESDLFDIHQLRHVITPEINLFSAAQNIHHNEVFIYDEPIDAVSDISAVQVALRQKWETKRGGPGQWRSVDALNFNVDLDLFAHKPPKQFLNPLNFRGLFFPSLPEASIARDALNADASWRLSDETVLLSDITYNLDKDELATAAIGLLVRRGDRLSYYIENRYVDRLGSNITSIHLDYNLTSKYAVAIDQAFDFSFGKNVTSGISVARHFDSFTLTLSVYEDVITRQSGVNFSFAPLGLSTGVGSGAFSNSLTR